MPSPPPNNTTLSPQQEVLQNADILALIFGALTVDDSMDNGQRVATRRALYAAALTCKSFKEIALDSLWRVMSSVFPLLNILPSFAMYQGSYILESEVEEKDWVVYHSYAKRIREVTFRPTTQGPKVSPLTILQLIRMHPTAEDILPMLKTMRILPGHVVYDNNVLLLPSRCLETMEFNDSPSYSRQLLPSLFATLCKHSPKLKHLTLRGATHRLDLNPVLGFSRLHSLDLGFPSTEVLPPFLCRLGRLEHLENLSLNLGISASFLQHGEQTASIGDPRKDSQFPMLRRLELIGHPRHLSLMMGELKPPRLISLIIQERPALDNLEGTATFWRNLFSCVASSPCLKFIEINQNPSIPQWRHAGFALSVDSLMPLMNLPNANELEEIVINQSAINVTDSHIQSIFSNLSGLKVFKLPLIAWGDDKPTVKSLVSISRSCTELETLQIPLAGGSVATELLSHNLLSLADSVDPLTHPLKELYFDNELWSGLHLEDGSFMVFAEFIDQIFPSLRKILLPDQKRAGLEGLVLEAQRVRVLKGVET